MSTETLNKNPRIFGYASQGSHYVKKSPEVQEHLILEKGKTIPDATWARCWTDTGDVIPKTRFADRPEAAKLIQELTAGDHLIVWRLDRLDENALGSVDALKLLIDRGVCIHVLKHGDLQFDLDQTTGALLVKLLSGFSSLLDTSRGEAVRAGKAWRKERGLAYHGCPPLGHIRLKHLKVNPKGQRKHDLFDVWDDKQCDLIREIAYRFDRGERMQTIGEDFRDRDERTWNKKPWVRVRWRKHFIRGKTHRRKRLTLERFYYVYWWYMERLAKGLDLKDLPCTVEQQEAAKQKLQQREERRRGGFRFTPVEH